MLGEILFAVVLPLVDQDGCHSGEVCGADEQSALSEVEGVARLAPFLRTAKVFAAAIDLVAGVAFRDKRFVGEILPLLRPQFPFLNCSKGILLREGKRNNRGCS